MARPSHPPRKGFKRVQSPLTPFRKEIEDLYLTQGWKLKDIVEHFKTNKSVVQSDKQFKTQLRVWGFRHKFTLRDAAFILRLLNQAKERGLPEVVLFSSSPRRPEDIRRYIQRKPDLVDEEHLLSHISDEDETPHYIRLQVLPVVQTLPISPQVPLTPPSGGSSGYLVPPVGFAEVPPMKHPIPSPEPSPRSSEEWSDKTTQAASSSTLNRVSMQETTMGSQPAVPNVLGPFWDSQQEPEQSPWWPQQQRSELNMQWPADFTNATLSSTPASMDQLGELGFDVSRFGDHTRSHQLNDGSPSAKFVMYCLFWLICKGQEDVQCQGNALYHLDSAMVYFVCMIQDRKSPGEACLGALSVVTVLFDCYGHTERLLELLMECDRVAKKHLGGNNPLTTTIAFKKNMLHRSGGRNLPHDVNRLRQIYFQTQRDYPSSRGPALTARYNLAWSMLENELNKVDGGVKDFRPAKRELEELVAQCESHFGPNRIETIMAVATLARASFCSGDGEKAEDIIVDIVCPRVRKNFPEDHPYTWEAKHRHAFLLLQLAKKERNSVFRSRLQHGEQLLREVVRDRQRILGVSNPKSIQSFQLLKAILEKQGKVDEANSLWEWCERQISDYGAR